MATKNAKIIKVVEAYCDDFEIQIDSLASMVAVESGFAENPRFLVTFLHNEVHRMKGAAQCLGFKFLALEFADLEDKLQEISARADNEIGAELPVLADHIQRIADFRESVRPHNSKLLSSSCALDELKVAEPDDLRELAKREASRNFMERERILFADDDPYICELIQNMLLANGAGEVMTAMSGQEVLCRLQDDLRPTFIITDWCMEPVTGIELVEQIRAGKTPLDRDVPVVFLTAIYSKSNARIANRAGATLTLRKPIEAEDLVNSVLKIAQSRYHMARIKEQRPRAA